MMNTLPSMARLLAALQSRSIWPSQVATLTVGAMTLLAGIGMADDARFAPPKDLNGFFPFTPPASIDTWDSRADYVRRRVLVSQGLWPPPTKSPLNPVIHGTITIADEAAPGGGYTISKVYFESLPGFFVTGNLYRPREASGKRPGVLFAHGHKKDARLTLDSPEHVRREIAAGAERFEQAGRSRYQAMCVQLVRMGCVVWQWDMLGDSDSQQLSRELVHGFAKQRPDMNRAEAWGLFSPQAENRLQNVMGLQTWNSIRSLDFLLSLPEVDPKRVAMTGSSGGGTQTMILAAVEDRLALSYPVVMVSTSMQGGCTCENASLLRIGTGNVGFAALFAPRPQGMNTADDWTREMATKGFPNLQKLYGMLAVADRVTLLRGEHFPHNYNAVTRSGFYTFLNRQFHLGFPEPVIERDYVPQPPEQLSVWDESHRAPPAADPAFERQLLANLAADVQRQVREAATTHDGVQRLLQPAFAVLIGRSFDSAGSVAWHLDNKQHEGDTVTQMDGILANTTHGEEVPVTWLYPATWTGDVVVWLDTRGRSVLAGAEQRTAEIAGLLARGTAVVAADLFHAREAAHVGASPPRQRTVDSPREFAGYTFGYNDPAFSRSVHDILTILSFLRNTEVPGHPRPARVLLAGFGDAAPVALAARVVAGSGIDRSIIDTQGFRFADLDDWRHPLFLPGAVRYLDVPGLVAAGATQLLLQGETTETLLPISRDESGGGSAGLDGAVEGRASLVSWLVETR